jgi:uncharacterized protein
MQIMVFVMYYNRYIENELNAAKSAKKVKLLLGPRQSGKSTLFKHCCPPGADIFYVNLQDRRERIKYERDKDIFLQELEAAANINTVVIDEIQKVPELFDDVQFFFDKAPERFNFFITGSSARQLKSHSANLLPGRIHLFRMTPVLQAEQRETVLLPLKTMNRGNTFPCRPLEDILIYGNLPGLFSESKEMWEETITAYSELYIENEIRKENIVNDMGNFLIFLRLAAMESGQTVNYSKLAGIVGVSVNTVKNYYQVLEDTFIGLRIPVFGRSRKKLVTAPRFILFDLGMRNALAGLPLNNTLIQLDAGHLFEQFVMIELFYRCQCLGNGYQLSFWRTVTGAEVDAVIEMPDEVIPVEIKWTDTPKIGDVRHINNFLKLHSSIAQRGYLICRIDKPRKLSDQITALPWNRF